MLEWILQARPKVVGFGIYIWNVEQTAKLISLKTANPEITIILVVRGQSRVARTANRRVGRPPNHWRRRSHTTQTLHSYHRAIVSRRIKNHLKKVWFGENPDVSQLNCHTICIQTTMYESRIMYVEASQRMSIQMVCQVHSIKSSKL